MKIKGIYGKQRKRLGKMEGFNLLIKLAKANKGPFIARELLATLMSSASSRQKLSWLLLQP